MDLSTAFAKSIKAYFEDDTLENLSSVLETDRKYTKAYFDSIEESFGLTEKKAKDEPKAKKD